MDNAYLFCHIFKTVALFQMINVKCSNATQILKSVDMINSKHTE